MKRNKLLVAIVTLLVFSCSPLLASTTSEVIEDSAITAKVKSKLIADKLVSSLNIHVETHDGVVALSGNANTNSEAATAIELAAATEGVKDVDTAKLTVNASEHPLVDSVITSKVKGIYLREKLFGDRSVAVMTVHVETKDGVVYLTGKVENATQANTAVDLAKSINGVKEVKSSISIEN